MAEADGTAEDEVAAEPRDAGGGGGGTGTWAGNGGTLFKGDGETPSSTARHQSAAELIINQKILELLIKSWGTRGNAQVRDKALQSWMAEPK